MLDTLQWPPLQERRRARSLTNLYKSVNNLSPVKIPDYVIPSSGRTRTHDLVFVQLRTNYEQYRHSFLPRTTREWNALPGPCARLICRRIPGTSADLHSLDNTPVYVFNCKYVILTMLLKPLARDASALGSIKLEVEVEAKWFFDIIAESESE